MLEILGGELEMATVLIGRDAIARIDLKVGSGREMMNRARMMHRFLLRCGAAFI